MNQNIKYEILEFLNNNPLAVVATYSYGSNFPESALIAFDQYNNFEIVFETFDISRKYKNLLNDPHVSIVVGWDTDRHITFQLEGIAHEISKDDYEKYIVHFLKKDTPCSVHFLHDKRVRLFKIKPNWFRYSNYIEKIPKIFEYNFDNKI